VTPVPARLGPAGRERQSFGLGDVVDCAMSEAGLAALGDGIVGLYKGWKEGASLVVVHLV
jgi:hypothetical protein